MSSEGLAAPQRPDVAGFVLAGGQSSRMGEDKALVQFAGRPLVERALETLRAAGLEPSIAGARSSAAIQSLKAFAPVVEDMEAGLGPLSGICTALASTDAWRAVFIPVDLPLLPATFVAFLLDHARITGRVVTLASVNGFAQSFPAVVDRAALPALRRELEAGRGGCFAGFQAACAGLDQPMTIIPVETVVQSGQIAHPGRLIPARWFLNVNRPQDLSRAEACFKERIA
ncbi:MAG: molybdenum cofactor guanylyltransferase [Terracidiphilus sp.]